MSRPKLILGSANFGPKPYGQLKEQLSLNSIGLMLNYARIHGISVLEGSEDYQCNPVLGNHYFDLIYKIRHPYNLNRIMENLGKKQLLGLMYHHGFDTPAQKMAHDPRVVYTGASIYDANQLNGNEEMIEVPLNIEDRRFESLTAPCKLVRSVFGRGELLKKYTIKECLDYIKSVPNIHGVIVGADNISQLAEIIKVWNE